MLTETNKTETNVRIFHLFTKEINLNCLITIIILDQDFI